MNCSICKWYNETTDYCFAIYCNAEDICPQKQYEKGRADAIDEFADFMLEKLPNNMDKTFTCGAIALLICGVAEQLKEQK